MPKSIQLRLRYDVHECKSQCILYCLMLVFLDLPGICFRNSQIKNLACHKVYCIFNLLCTVSSQEVVFQFHIAECDVGLNFNAVSLPLCLEMFSRYLG